MVNPPRLGALTVEDNIARGQRGRHYGRRGEQHGRAAHAGRRGKRNGARFAHALRGQRPIGGANHQAVAFDFHNLVEGRSAGDAEARADC